MIDISKTFTFDMAHRLTFHAGKCRNLHGHTYRLEVFLTGEPDENGFIADFADLKTTVKTQVINKLDHSVAIYDQDEILMPAIPESLKRVIFPFETTAENLVQWIFRTIDKYDHRISQVILWETPTSKARYIR